MTIYHYPVLSSIDLGLIRNSGPGLGNLLFPIARALIGQLKLGGSVVFPTMRQMKIGPILRGERDSRIYGNVLRSRTLSEWRTWTEAITCPAVPEGHRLDRRNWRINYQGLGRYFNDLAGYHELVSSWLYANALASDATKRTTYDIAIHVRLGDFLPENPERPNCSERLSMDWYRRALESARQILGVQNPSIVLFTDGDELIVSSTLAYDRIVVDDSPNALFAIQRIGQAQILVTSRSTFSMWGAYLSNIRAVWDARADISSVFPMRNGLDYLL